MNQEQLRSLRRDTQETFDLLATRLSDVRRVPHRVDESVSRALDALDATLRSLARRVTALEAEQADLISRFADRVRRARFEPTSRRS